MYSVQAQQTTQVNKPASQTSGSSSRSPTIAELVNSLMFTATPAEQEGALQELSRRSADVTALAAMSQKQGLVSDLIALLSNQNTIMQLAAASLLSSLCAASTDAQQALATEPEAAEILLLLLKDPVIDLRAIGARLVAACAAAPVPAATVDSFVKYPSLVSRLGELSTDPVPKVQLHACIALSNMMKSCSPAGLRLAAEQPGVVPGLLSVLDNTDSPACCQHAAMALACLGHSSSVLAAISKEPKLVEQL